MKTRQILLSILIAIVGGLIAVFVYAMFDRREPAIVVEEKPAVRYINLPGETNAAPSDFITAAEIAVDGVVHVKTKALREGTGNPIFDYFFGYRYSEPEPVVGYGSGVIISDNGYIVTNNHVIEGSQTVEVILNDKRSFEAEIIGNDPSTDIAVLKIKANRLPYLLYGNSDVLRLGEWVLAIGNPYNLTSTVTAGIVSAKARSINILSDNMAIEAFIQTDAAVNPGNSGGALVNTQGQLVGINAAIASRTGAFSGYSFAIPVSIVKKVVDDIIEFGSVQRAILGVTITEVTAESAKEYNIDRIEGVIVTGLRENSSAIEAGIERGDQIIAVNGVRVNDPSQLQEQISRYRPNDKITVTIIRNNKERQLNVVLRNPSGTTGMIQKAQTIEVLGASFGEVSSMERKTLGINNGVKVIQLTTGKFRNAGIREGFIITQINNTSVSTPKEVEKVINNSQGGMYVEGVYPDGLVAYYSVRL
jgi:Do/DeqQ family serine protease